MMNKKLVYKICFVSTFVNRKYILVFVNAEFKNNDLLLKIHAPDFDTPVSLPFFLYFLSHVFLFYLSPLFPFVVVSSFERRQVVHKLIATCLYHTTEIRKTPTYFRALRPVSLGCHFMICCLFKKKDFFKKYFRHLYILIISQIFLYEFFNLQ